MRSRTKLETLKLTEDRNMKEIIRALWRDKVRKNINVEWHPDGIIISEDIVNPNITTYTSGKIVIHWWYILSKAEIEAIGWENYHPERHWTVEGATYTLPTDGLYHMYAMVPISELITFATILFSLEELREDYFPGYITILMGIGNVPNPDRVWSMLWNGISHIPRALPPLVTRFIETGESWCQVVGGYNTGLKVIETKQQYRTASDNWVDVEPQVLGSYLTGSGGMCPVKMFGIWISVGPAFDAWNAGHEYQMVYSENTFIGANSLIEPGMNYLYYSIPANKTVVFYDADEKDITTHFGVIGPDIREGYHDNSIYRLDVAFDTSKSVAFKIVIR